MEHNNLKDYETNSKKSFDVIIGNVNFTIILA